MVSCKSLPVYAEKTEYKETLEETIPVIITDDPEYYSAKNLEIIEETPMAYSEKDYELLAHLLMGEAGAEWCEDEMVYLVGCVALNRVKSDKFPDTLEEVIYQKGQYQCTVDGNFDREPTERCWEIAYDLLAFGSYIPETVVYQAEFKQGSGTYKQVQNMYFCYE